LDRQRLVNQASLEPVAVDGVIQAWRLQHLAPDSELIDLGLTLMEGDLITAVNNIPVSQSAAVIETLKASADQEGVLLSVVREGRPLHVTARWGQTH